MNILSVLMGPERQVAPGDPLGRTSIGYRPGLTEDEVWERSRGLWKLNPTRVLGTCDTVLAVDPDDVVRAVATIRGVTRHGGRYAIEGNLVRGHRLVGRRSPVPHRSRNPVAYESGR